MQLLEVSSPKDWKLFHRTLDTVYKDDPLFVKPLQGEVESILQADKNEAVENGASISWVLLGDDGNPIGRIGAFINHAHNQQLSFPVGGLGFFECIDDTEAAHRLLEAAENWVREQGGKAVDGPINFGRRDMYWGLLTKGHEYMPLFQENYQPPYYRKFFESRGYLPFEQVLTFHGDSERIPFDRFNKVVDRLAARYDVRVEQLDWSKVDKYAEDFCLINNAAFGGYEYFKPFQKEEVLKAMREAKPIADTQILSIAYFEGQPAGFCAFFPDINPLLKKANGRLNWKTIPGFLWRKATTPTFGAKGIGFAVHPEYKTKGIFAFLTHFMATPRNVKRYPDMYICTVRAHNTEAVSIYFKLGVRIQREHIAFRKPLAEGVTIEPHEFVDPDHYVVEK